MLYCIETNQEYDEGRKSGSDYYNVILKIERVLTLRYTNFPSDKPK